MNPPQSIVDYVQSHLEHGTSEEQIWVQLLNTGWEYDQIQAAFDVLKKPTAQAVDPEMSAPAPERYINNLRDESQALPSQLSDEPGESSYTEPTYQDRYQNLENNDSTEAELLSDTRQKYGDGCGNAPKHSY